MDVTVRFFGIRSELINRSQVELTLPGEATLRNVLEALGEQFGEKVQRRLFSPDGRCLGDTICLTVNDRIVAEEALESALKDMGSERPRVSLAVVFAIAGG